MNDYQPTSTSETVPDSKPRPRRLPWSRRGRWISAAALALAATGISVGFAASGSTTAPSNSATTAAHFPRLAAGGAGSAGEPSNARSGPAAGGADGTVSDESTSSFTLMTSTGQKVTIDENSSTEYLNATGSTSASAVTNGESVLVLGTTDSTTITASQVIIGYNFGSSPTASTVIPFKRGTATDSKEVGQIPANWSQGQGTIVSGAAANKATEAALAAYPGAVVDRVVLLSNGEYNVHYIGVNWPHHVFETASFKVVGAE